MGNLKFKVMIGVIPGYGHENKDLTASNALEVGMKEWKDAVENVANTKSDLENSESQNFYNVGGKIVPALAVYSQKFGCPIGGEVGIQVESSINEAKNEEKDEEKDEKKDEKLYRKSVIETIKVAMEKLGQNTATIEWSEEDRNKGMTYLSEGGKKKTDNDSKEGIEHFSVSLGDGTSSNEEFVRVGCAIQDAMDKVSDTRTGKNDEKYYMISGIMTPIHADNGGIQFSASQNPLYGQKSNELYRQSVIKTIEQVMKTLGQKSTSIDFGKETVTLDLEEILKQESEMGELSE